MNNNLTVIIVVYKTNRVILENFISQIDKNYKLLIIDNNSNYDFKNINKFKNIKIFRSDQNKGNGDGINIALNMVDTDYAMYFDIDTIFEKTLLDEIENYIKKIKDFCILIPNINSTHDSARDVIETYKAQGAAMLFNVSQIKEVGLFDNNFFLYWEESDLYLRCKRNKKKIFVLPKINILHNGSTSMEGDNENLTMISLRNWHYMWSLFYFYKKNYSYFFAFKKTYIFLIKDFLKLLYFLIKKDKLNICIRSNRLFGLINSIFLRKSYKRL